MADLDENVLEFIDDIKPVIQKELRFMKKNDWTVEPNFKKRVELQKLEQLISGKAISNAERLFTLAGDNVDHPTVSKIMTKLISFFDTAKKRFDAYTKKADLADYLEKEGNKVEDLAGEIKFQSEIHSGIISLRDSLKKINFGSANKSLEIKTFNSVPIPFAMHQKAIRRYPEITKYLDNNGKSGIFEEN